MPGAHIVGPTYIGPRAFIGKGALVRESFIGEEGMVGFSCEVGRSFIWPRTKLYHVDVVPDSFLGSDIMFSGFNTTLNLRVDYGQVKSQVGGRLVSTGMDKLGVIIGDRTVVGARLTTLPGRKIGADCMLEDNLRIERDVPDRMIVTAQ